MDSGGGVKLESHNLRDILRLKEEEQHSSFNESTSSNGAGGRSSASGLTLLAILAENGGPPADVRGVQSSRTLLDIIREDQIGGGRRDGGRRWRNLTDKIRLRHGGTCGSGWSSAVTVDDNSRRSTQFQSNAHLGESSQFVLNARVPIPHDNSSAQTESADVPIRRSVTDDTDNAAGVEGEQPARASLMELLAENDFQLGFGGSSIEEEEEEENDNWCCVCMVRHKGAAFIPCGHTFCRVCSRELWIQRGNCPLCNNYISEILDIF